jgi:diguanylate cyclase
MIKGQDTAARIGGEEFVVFLPDTPIEGAAKLAEHIRATIAAGRISTATTGEVGRITVSLGRTDYRSNDSIESYLARADKALYASKAGGRNRVTIDAVNAHSGKHLAATNRMAVNNLGHSQTITR